MGMLQQFLEFTLLVVGLYALMTGKLPLAFGSNPTHRLEPRTARLIGILLIAPFPLLFCIGIFMAFVGVPVEKIGFTEPLIILLVLITVFVIAARSIKPVETADDVTKETP